MEQKSTNTVGLKNEALTSHESWSGMFRSWLIEYEDCISLSFLVLCFLKPIFLILRLASLKVPDGRSNWKWEVGTYVQEWKRYYFFPCVSFFSEEHLSPKSFGRLYPCGSLAGIILCFMLKPISGKALDQSGPGAISKAHGLGADNRWQNSIV